MLRALTMVKAGLSILLTLSIGIGMGHDNQVAPAYAQASAQPEGRFFPETGHAVLGRFLAYWEQHGGLAQQGYPLTEEIQEVSPTNGRVYTVQYFERAVFELHPEEQAPYDVLLSLLGVFEYAQRHGVMGAHNQMPSSDNPIFFEETSKKLGGKFRQYWETHGGLRQQGYPISDEVQETSALDGRTYTVQYFERAVFELHPENEGTSYEVLLSQLGTFRYMALYQSLNIPAPGRGKRQVMPQGSDSYLVWVEGAEPDQRDQDYDVMALSLKTNRPITVTNAPGNQLFPSISGSTVVWVSNKYSSGEYDVLGMDLATDREFSIATGPNDQSHPAIAGKKVSWVEMSREALKLLVKDLENGEQYEVESFPLQNGMGYGPTFGRTAMSQEYLVWSELAPYRRSTGQLFELRAMNLKTREVRSVYEGAMGITGVTDDISLSGHRLVYNTPDLQVIDLSTGVSHTLFIGGGPTATIYRDTVVWVAQGSIWGLKLNEPGVVPRQLVKEHLGGGDYAVTAAIAGDWLVWNNVSGPKAGTLSVRPLGEAFAAAVRP